MLLLLLHLLLLLLLQLLLLLSEQSALRPRLDWQHGDRPQPLNPKALGSLPAHTDCL